MQKYYCTECKRFLNRLQVAKEEDILIHPIYFCKWCDSSVIRVDKVMNAVAVDFIDYLVSKGKREDFE